MDKKESKKSIILRMFNNHPFQNGTKSISYDTFRKYYDLYVEPEGGYDDVQYAATILRKMGYKALIGSLGLHIWDREENDEQPT